MPICDNLNDTTIDDVQFGDHDYTYGRGPVSTSCVRHVYIHDGDRTLGRIDIVLVQYPDLDATDIELYLNSVFGASGQLLSK